MSDREWILGRLQEAHRNPGPLASPASAPVSADWDEFRSRFEALGGVWIPRLEAIEWPDRAVVDEDTAELVPAGVERTDDPWSAEIGVTSVDLAIAETGSLLIGNLPGRRRLNSLAPPIHLAVCRRQALIGSFADAMSSLPDRTAVLISGSSRTADIEGVLVRGVHGPRELWLVVQDE